VGWEFLAQTVRTQTHAILAAERRKIELVWGGKADPAGSGRVRRSDGSARQKTRCAPATSVWTCGGASRAAAAPACCPTTWPSTGATLRSSPYPVRQPLTVRFRLPQGTGVIEEFELAVGNARTTRAGKSQ